MAWNYIELTKVGSNGNIARLALNRPEILNATCDAMIDELSEAAEVIERSPDISVVILCGNGRAFCAGGDLKEQANTLNLTASKERMDGAGRAALRLVNLDRPVIGMVHGSAVGAGFSLAMVGDIIYAAQNAKFGALFNQVGLGPDMGTSYLLQRLVGRAKAKEIIMTGRIINAEEAERIGLVNRIFPPEELEQQVMDLAEHLARGPQLSLRLGKQAVNRAADLSLEQALDYERYIQTVCFMSEDHKEGLSAFFDKRSPLFNGK